MRDTSVPDWPSVSTNMMDIDMLANLRLNRGNKRTRTEKNWKLAAGSCNLPLAHSLTSDSHSLLVDILTATTHRNYSAAISHGQLTSAISNDGSPLLAPKSACYTPNTFLHHYLHTRSHARGSSCLPIRSHGGVAVRKMDNVAELIQISGMNERKVKRLPMDTPKTK